MEKTCSLLENDLQAQWTFLVSSVSQKFSYHQSLQYPSDIRPHAERLDTILWGMLEAATGLHIPRGEEGLGVECVLQVPVRGLEAHSYQQLLARLPIRERGMGVRSLVETCPAAFLGGVEMALPFITGEQGLCPLLEPLVGDIRGADPASRWRTLTTAGSRTGREFLGAFNTLQEEATDCCLFLGEELEGMMSVGVEGLGEGRVDGSSRALLTQQREKLRARVMFRALKEHPDQTARPTWVFPQLDKTSCAWLLATPSPETFNEGPSYPPPTSGRLWRPTCASPPPAASPWWASPPGARTRGATPPTSTCGATW